MTRMVRHPDKGTFVRKAGGGPKPKPKPTSGAPKVGKSKGK